MTDCERLRAGYHRLPQSLDEALDQLCLTEATSAWFGDEFREVYLRFKHAEARAVSNMTEEVIIAKYADVY